MSRINDLFQRKSRNVLNIYFTAGFPDIEGTGEIIRSLDRAGVDIVELGMPYSDPLADGPVIQHSSAVALANGMTITKLFSQLEGFRKLTGIPLVLMGYMNPVLQYGFERFCKDASAVGVDGLILPDLPVYEFEKEYGPVIRKYGLDFIFLVTPETPDDRVRKLDQLSSGFLYAVSSSSTTGSDKDMGLTESYLLRLGSLGLKNPLLVGFGIRDHRTFSLACEYANGAIVGTAFIKALETNGSTETSVKAFIDTILVG